MNRVIAVSRQWWDGRTVRERRMLSGLMILIAVVLVWLAVVRPALMWRADATEDRRAAQAMLTQVRADLRGLAGVGSASAATTDPQGLEPMVRQSAEAAGLEVTTSMDASGRLGFRITRGSSAAVFGWLAGLKSAHGLDATALGVTENADATLQVEGAF